MYMTTMVSSGSFVRILYPRESYDSWADHEGLVRMVCQVPHGSLLGFYIIGNLMIPWTDPEGPVRIVSQSTTNVVVDAPTSFCCHM
jgi:hypothetical protein